MNLEQRLLSMAPDAFPATPDMAGAVAARLRSADVRSAGPRRRRRPRAWVLAAALLIPVTAVAAVPGLRDPVLRWLGLSSIKVVRVGELPKLPRVAEVDLGAQTGTVAAASRRAGFAVQVPGSLGPPQRVHVAAGIVTVVYGEVVVTEVRARREPEILTKQINPRTSVERVDVDGAPGVYLSGAPHQVSFLTPAGQFSQLPSRLAGNTLAFQRDGLVIRIEGERLTLDRALQLARATAPAPSR